MDSIKAFDSLITDDLQFICHPWTSLVVDNFLPDILFAELCSIQLDPAPADGVVFNENIITSELDLQLSILSERLALSIHEYCLPKLIGYLQLLAPSKIPLYDYSQLYLVQTGQDYKHPVHSDLSCKLLSVVVYLDPSESSGTFLYSTHRNEHPFEVEWKTNRALIFSRKEKSTWHSYSGSASGERRALVYNLMTDSPHLAFYAEKSPKRLSKLQTKLRGMVATNIRKLALLPPIPM